MSRAVSALAAALTCCCLLTTADAVEVERTPDVVDGGGLLDYRGKPTFSVGSWVRYRTQGSSLQGHKDDYTVTILIAGEEVCWGEPCVWVETWTDKSGRASRSTASLVSYSAFGDTMAYRRVMWFMRKTINGLLPDGTPDVILNTRGSSEFALRKINWDQEDQGFARTDTLGADTVVTVPAGTFTATRVVKTRGRAETSEKGDSTVYYARQLRQTFYMNRKVPITSMVQLDVDDIQQGKSWLAGQFDRGPLSLLERAQGSTTLLEYGSGGLIPRLVPESARHPIADRRLVEQFMSLPGEPATKVLKPGGMR